MAHTPPLIIEPKQSARSAIIWLHGLGADAHDFEGIVPLLPTEACAARMVFPNAPVRPVTINGGMRMRAWYDIRDTRFRHADQQGITASQQAVSTLIDEQIVAGISSDKIVVAGFSQGGAMAIHTGLRYTKKLAGIVGLSCYVLDQKNPTYTAENPNKETPIWLAHGLHDPVVPYTLGGDSASYLSQQGHPVTFMSYPIAHEVSMPEIAALSDWLLALLGQ